MSPFVCYPRGGTPCIDDVCRSMGECAWPPPKESSNLINDTGRPIQGGACSADDPEASKNILKSIQRKTGRDDLEESDLHWKTENGMLGGWVYDEKAEQLYKLADEYHQRCDDFDRLITGREDGFPITNDQRRESIRNAREVDRELFHKAEELGYDKETWRAARRRATPR